MQDVDLTLLKKRSLSGVLALTSRSFLLYFVAIAGNLLLTLFLSVADFGIYFVVTAIISFLSYFSDIGLAAALIQKKEELTQDDLRSTFTIQQLLTGTLILIAFIFSFFLSSLFAVGDDGVGLFRALVVALFLSSLKTIPSVILERRFDFHLLVIPQVVETFVFYLVAVLLAWRGFGITSLTWAVLARSVSGLAAIYIVSPWKVSVGISKNGMQRLLQFGIPFQINSFLALIKDDLLTVFLGYLLPIRDLGYIGWAKKWSDMPLRMFMDNIIKVTFPAYSRIQHSKILLSNAVQNTLFGISVTIFPVYIALVFLIDPVVKIIPRYEQWMPGILSFILFCGADVLASISTPLINVFNATGNIKTTLKLMIFWVTVTWIITMIMIRYFGFNGVALSVFIVSSSLVLVVYLAKKIAPFNLWSSISSATIGSLLVAVIFTLFRGQEPYSILRLIVVSGMSIVVYGIFLWTRDKVRILNIVRIFRS